MKKLTIIFSAFLFLTAFTTFNDVWKNDPPHSQLGFTITHLGISEISGTFNEFEATINSTKPDFSDAVITMEAKVASIDTRVTARDNHLKSPDFFDAEKYPTLNFQSSGIKSAGKNKYKLTGNLTLHGITKPVTLDLEYKGGTVNPQSKKQIAGFQVKGVIKRSDFAVGNGFPPPMLSDEVQIKADGEFIKE